MGIVGSIKGKIFSTVVDKIAASEPRTTALGFVLAGIQAANIDYGKLLQKDPQQIGQLIAAIVTALLGYYINHPGITRPTASAVPTDPQK